MSQKAKLFITISLLLNMVLLGVVGGLLYTHQKERPGRMPPILWGDSALPTEKRKAFEAAMQQTGKELQPLIEQIAKARARSNDLLAAEPFDQRAYMQSVSKLHYLFGRQFAVYAGTVREFAAKLSLPERQALAEVLKRTPPGRFARQSCAKQESEKK